MRAKLPKGTLEKLWSDPQNWRGAFYFCKDDPRDIVPKRLKKFGWTINFAHPSAWLGLLVGMAVTAGIILYLEKSDRSAWIFPTLVAMVIFSIINGRFKSSTIRYEKNH